ncbi:MAG: NAD(P)-dependent oxidoreductase [Sterolibacterium sp.]|jgi:nucleoside-diphosphate-sugar epimerase
MDNRRIPRGALLTGATGFVGSHLAARLARDGWRVSVVVRPESSLTSLQNTLPSAALLRHDGTTAGMIDLVRQAKADVIFHLASQFVAEHTHADVETLICSNILFATQLVEAMAANRNIYLINTGSSWQHDDTGYAPVNLYAATKQAFEDILAYYGSAHGLRVITLALFDTYGPADPRRKLLSILGQAIKSGEPLSLSPGRQLIDLVYIDDVVDAYVHCADLLPKQENWHARYGISSGQPRTLRELVAVIESNLGITLPAKWGGRPYRDREVMIPWTKSTPPPGWAPRTPLEAGIARTMGATGDWH